MTPEDIRQHYYTQPGIRHRNRGGLVHIHAHSVHTFAPRFYTRLRRTGMWVSKAYKFETPVWQMQVSWTGRHAHNRTHARAMCGVLGKDHIFLRAEYPRMTGYEEQTEAGRSSRPAGLVERSTNTLHPLVTPYLMVQGPWDTLLRGVYANWDWMVEQTLSAWAFREHTRPGLGPRSDCTLFFQQASHYNAPFERYDGYTHDEFDGYRPEHYYVIQYGERAEGLDGDQD